MEIRSLTSQVSVLTDNLLESHFSLVWPNEYLSFLGKVE